MYGVLAARHSALCAAMGRRSSGPDLDLLSIMIHGTHRSSETLLRPQLLAKRIADTLLGECWDNLDTMRQVGNLTWLPDNASMLSSQSVETHRDLEKLGSIVDATLHLSFSPTIGFANSTERHSRDGKSGISLRAASTARNDNVNN